jgi:predicted nucleic acid-binding protein
MKSDIFFVVDTNIFTHALSNLNIDVFDDIYKPWSKGINDKYIISVDEVYNELMRYWDQPEKDKRTKECNWLKDHKIAFQAMTNMESQILRSIFQSPKFREGVKEKSIRSGSPEADAILVAKAKNIGGIIVTNESNSKENAEKIPNICVSFAVPYISRDNFYYILKHNISKNRYCLDNIIPKLSLEP